MGCGVTPPKVSFFNSNGGNISNGIHLKQQGLWSSLTYTNESIDDETWEHPK
jgi:hypothetical protein